MGNEVLLNSILNLFGVLKYKKMAEDFLSDSGIPYTIIRYESATLVRSRVI
jgi:hypothetical protein